MPQVDDALELCFLADARSVHTQRWAEALVGRGHHMTVLSMRPGQIGGARVIDLKPWAPAGRLGYLALLRKARSIIASLQPSLIHCHYATSYGLIGARTRYHPLVLSLWGTDVYDFPKRSPFHRALLEANLRSADVILSTSRAMADEAKTYTQRPIGLTPFGVDTALFAPVGSERVKPRLTIGSVKPLEPVYGIPTLVEAFELLVSDYPSIHLMIVGDGSQKSYLQTRVARAGLQGRVTFMPAVPHDGVPRLMHKMDILVVPSYSESFGVVALEAAASELPVVASAVGGLPEVVIDGVTGFLVKPGNRNELAYVLGMLIQSPRLRREMGQRGRDLVLQKYSWRRAVEVMEQVYWRTVLDVPIPSRDY